MDSVMAKTTTKSLDISEKNISTYNFKVFIKIFFNERFFISFQWIQFIGFYSYTRLYD